MSAGEVDTCNSCLVGYNNKDRIPKILSCYHTYCRSCLEQFMFQDSVITCLSCGKTTPAESVSSLPENPYLRPKQRSPPVGGQFQVPEKKSTTLILMMMMILLRQLDFRMAQMVHMYKVSRTWSSTHRRPTSTRSTACWSPT